MTAPEFVSLDQIRAARARIREHIRETPLERSHYFSAVAGAEVYLKMENLQVTGSFKPRGALNKMLQLSPAARARGVVTASAGNHGQAVGLGAQLLALEATVVVPRNTPPTKLGAMRRLGVDLVIHGDVYDAAERHARQIERDTGKVFVSPYNDHAIIAGQGTVALEILATLPAVEAIVVPVGGGGLIAGIARCAAALNPELVVYGVQSEASPVWKVALAEEKLVEMDVAHSIAEGLHGNVEPGSVTFPYVREFVRDILLVSEDEIRAAVRDVLREHHLVVEPSGSAGLAGLENHAPLFAGKTVAAVLSGANLDYALLQDIVCG